MNDPVNDQAKPLLDRIAETPEERERMEQIAGVVENKMAGMFTQFLADCDDKPRRNGTGFPARMMAR
jgi:hypothetical protein